MMFASFARTATRRPFAVIAVSAVLALSGGAVLAPTLPALSADAKMSRDQVYKDIEKTLGGVPAFVKQLPDSAVAGAWQEIKDVEFSDTALPAKVKSLISLAVAAQIPCQYCIWADTRDAKQAGATDQEIAEAVTVAALTRHWSTIFNGLQVDFTQFKKDLGGDEQVAK
jgi:AhpD family alkylhydroperoxidase